MLEQLVEPIKAQIESLEKTFPETLRHYCDYSDLSAILDHATQAPGKWLRSVLCMYFAHMIALKTQGRVDSEKLLTAAHSIEAIHLASLLHDDIFDEAKLRRNVECVYQKYGMNAGILSGVYIYSLALQRMTRLNDLAIVENMGATVSHLCEGEFRQLNQRHCWEMPIEEYFKIVDQKTAALFASACFMGAKIMQASESDLQLAKNFGRHFGVLFQLLDDYKDCFDADNALKKDPFQDLLMGDVSYPLLLIRSFLTQEQWEQLREFAVQKDFEACRAIVTQEISGKIKDQLEEKIHKHIQKLESILEQFDDSIFSQNLHALNEYLKV